MIDIKVPTVGESISEVTLVKWLKNDGDWVERDEVIAELESEKATFEINAEKAGALKTVAKEGDTLKIGDTAAQIDENAAKPEGVEQSAAASRQSAVASGQSSVGSQQAAVASSETTTVSKQSDKQTKTTETKTQNVEPKTSPVAAAILADKG